jgi:type II secretory pathway predicted ATPase ExeA
MYELFLEHFGLQRDPSHVSPDPHCFYSTSACDGALGQLVFGIESRQDVMVLTGDPGSGKTKILHCLLEWLLQQGYSTSFVFHSQVSSLELLEMIVQDFGIHCPSLTKCDLWTALHNWLLSRYRAADCPVILIDEAQALSHRALDELGMLLKLEVPGGKPVQVVLAGQLKLNEKLRHLEFLQLRQRIVFHCKLPQLTREETFGYLRNSLTEVGTANEARFPGESVGEIHRCSRGTPRAIDVFCEHGPLTADARHFNSPTGIHRIVRQFAFGTWTKSFVESPEAQPHGGLAAFPQLELLAEPASPPGTPIRIAAHRGSRPAPRFLPYLRGVRYSFVRDCRELISSMKTCLEGQPRTIARRSQATRQTTLAALSNWLRQPSRRSGILAERPRTTSAVPKHF